MKRNLIITLSNDLIIEIDLIARGQLPIGVKSNDLFIQKICEEFATKGFWNESTNSYIAPGNIKLVSPDFTDLKTT